MENIRTDIVPTQTYGSQCDWRSEGRRWRGSWQEPRDAPSTHTLMVVALLGQALRPFHLQTGVPDRLPLLGLKLKR